VESSVEAVDLATGATVWTSPLERDITDDNWTHGSNQTVWEDPRDGATPGAIVVHRNQFSAFDADTGALLWHVKRIGGEYIGYGVAAYDTDVNSWTARSAKTGAVVWTKNVPSFVNTGAPTTMVGPVGWWINSRGVYAIDVRTGRQVMNRVFPQTWKRVVTTPTLTLAFDGKNLQLYRTADVRTPIWSTPGDDVSPLAVSAGLVAVRAQAGVLALSGSDGSLQPGIDLSGLREGVQVVDGLVQGGGAGIYELAAPGAP
jgi:hypothetical protein